MTSLRPVLRPLGRMSRAARGGGRAAALGDAGFAALEFVAGIGLLVLPIAILVLSVPQWAETQTSARSIAREAARVLATAESDAAGQRDAAAMAERIAANLGTELSAPVRFRGSVETPAGRESDVTASVTVRLPLLNLPFFSGLAAVDWVVEHTEPVDPYRSRP